jgi:hypothetical protein
MTFEEWIKANCGSWDGGFEFYHKIWQAAQESMRERCAKIAENPKNWTRHGGTTGDAIAKDIRARRTP